MSDETISPAIYLETNVFIKAVEGTFVTADLRAVARLKLPDAIHLVSAIRNNCRVFVSGDDDFKSLPVGMTRVRPDDEETIDVLLKQFP